MCVDSSLQVLVVIHLCSSLTDALDCISRLIVSMYSSNVIV